MPVQSFEPIIDENTRVLVLGTMPGEVSLSKGQYYANTSNQFWDIVYALFDAKRHLSYKEKVTFLRQHGIGLWDVLHQAERKGSLDSAIKQGKANDFRQLLTEYPNVRAFVFNGGKAAKLFKQHVKYPISPTIKTIELPSTSATPGRYVKPYEEKLQDWRVLLSVLRDGTSD